MRHLNAGRKLNRSSSHRRALLRNLVTSLLQHEHLQTTDAKAKEMRRWVDRMITLGKRNTRARPPPGAAFVRGRDVVKKLFDDIAPRFADRPGRLHPHHQARQPPRRRRAGVADRARRAHRPRPQRGGEEEGTPPPRRAEEGRGSGEGGAAAG